MFERGRQGQKTGAGYYRYEGRKAVDDPEVERIAADLARAHRIARRDAIAGDEVIERLLYPLFNEGAAILREGIAYRGSDIDVVWTAGYGFPAWRGGPMHMADRVGLVRIVGTAQPLRTNARQRLGVLDGLAAARATGRERRIARGLATAPLSAMTDIDMRVHDVSIWISDSIARPTAIAKGRAAASGVA
ncbi:MAG: 3-hydroxyacyl-CoA dehydrogenase family protein [Pseudomonas sp.]